MRMRLLEIHFAKTLREISGRHRRPMVGVDVKTIGFNTVGENYLPDEYCGAREILRHTRKRDCFAQGGVRITTIDDHSARWASKQQLNTRQSAKYLRRKGWRNGWKRPETHEKRHRLLSPKPHKE